jgi:hypothetical protein
MWVPVATCPVIRLIRTWRWPELTPARKANQIVQISEAESRHDPGCKEHSNIPINNTLILYDLTPGGLRLQRERTASMVRRAL